MNRQVVLAGALLCVVGMGGAMAQCFEDNDSDPNAGWAQELNVASEVTNNFQPLGLTVCNADGQGFQEEHHADGTLWDFKLGNGHPVDPREQVGAWAVQNDGSPNATITYTYSAGHVSGPYKIYRNQSVSNQFDFCDASDTSIGLFTYYPTAGTTRVCP